MSTALQKLSSLHVEHVMARDVVTVRADTTMAEAARQLCNFGISGVPVVDDEGRCIGVLSASDFVHSKTTEPAADAAEPHGIFRIHKKDVAKKATGDDLVRAHMSPDVHTIREHRSIVDAGRIMCEEHIHRLVVLDRASRPVGIVSSLDLVSALIHAAEV
jgi:CBS-domain-containing membrane protein